MAIRDVYPTKYYRGSLRENDISYVKKNTVP